MAREEDKTAQPEMTLMAVISDLANDSAVFQANDVTALSLFFGLIVTNCRTYLENFLKLPNAH